MDPDFFKLLMKKYVLIFLEMMLMKWYKWYAHASFCDIFLKNLIVYIK